MTDDDDEGWISVVVHNRLLTVKLSDPEWGYDLTIEVRDWLRDNVGPNWKSNMVWNEFVSDDGDETDLIGWYTMYFENERDAILFKLRWS